MKKNTLRSYQSIIDPFCKEFGDRPIDKVTPDETLSFLNRLTLGNRPYTERIRYSQLSCFFNFIRNNIQPDTINPCDMPMIRGEAITDIGLLHDPALMAIFDWDTIAHPTTFGRRLGKMSLRHHLELQELVTRLADRLLKLGQRLIALDYAISPAAIWQANFRDLNGAVTRMATLAPGGRITLAEVKEETVRLQAEWKAAEGGFERREDQAGSYLSDEARARIDPFDLAKLAEVLRMCTTSRSLSEAGRRLFTVSRLTKKTVNDADRLRKYLARFDLKWTDLVTAEV